MNYYQSSATAESTWVWVLWATGCLPFLIEVVLFFFEAATGDPPNSLSEFKAYHYAASAAIALALCWGGAASYTVWRRRRWLILLIAAWCAWECWIGIGFLQELNAHPAADYYWGLWKG